MDKTRTPGYRAVAKTIREMREHKGIRSATLNLNWYGTLYLLPPEIADLVWLKALRIEGSPIEDLSPIVGLTALESLSLEHTRVNDLSALSGMTTLQDAAVAMSGGIGLRGLYYVGTPISRRAPFDSLVLLGQPARTVETINEIRRQQNLLEYFPIGYDRLAEISAAPPPTLEPLMGVPSAFGFQIASGKIKLTASSADCPVFPFPTSERDHSNRLEVCRTLAEDLVSDLESGRFNARPDYAGSLTKYAQRLPRHSGEANVLLADAEARTLRTMFAADVDVLAVGIASKLKTILEHHIGLRVYYPEIEHFYRDVRSGRIEAPLPLDAVQGFVRGVEDNTPSVFDPHVRDAITGTSERDQQTPKPTDIAPRARSDGPTPPPDPLGELDPNKARDFTIAGVVNGLWGAFREGERVHAAIDGWKKAGQALRPHVQPILEWLRDFVRSQSSS